MKLAILGDLHIGVKNSNDIMLNHQSRFFKFMFDELSKRNVTTILQLGDLFDQRRQINLKALQFAQDHLFEPLSAAGIEFYTLIGNHDIYYRETLDIHSSGLLLKPYRNVHVIGTPETLSFGSKTFDIIPWICTDNSEVCLSYIDKSLSDYCLGHFDISNFVMIGNTKSENGLDPQKFAHYKQVFSGHFHSKSEDLNIRYTGTPYELTWADANREKGFYILDTESGELEWIETPIRYYTYLEYDEENHVISTLKAESITDCFVKVIVKSKIEPFVYENFTNELFNLKPADVKIVDGDLIDISSDATDTAVVTVSDIPELIHNYIFSLDASDDEKVKLNNIMISLYNEAQRGQDSEEE